MSEKPKDWLEYEEYDVEYADAVYEEAEYLARRRRKARPKRGSANLIPGIVVRARGHHFDVQTEETALDLKKTSGHSDRRVRLCEVRRRLRQDRTVDTLVAVGDHVWIAASGQKRGHIERIDERQSVLSRQRPGVSQPAEDVILANPDQVLTVFAAADPAPHLRMLDRFLVIAEFSELPAVICVNKIDLTDPAQTEALFSRYAGAGYPIIYASAQTGQGIAELEELLTDRLTVVTGPSGVGKSSLLNAIHPQLQLDVGALRDHMGKGKHTTRAARLIALPFGERTFVADTPGIRELGLYEIDPADLGFYFVDIEPYVNQCRFPNCTHDHEPGCAVRSAVEAQKIHPERYASYLKLLSGEAAA